MEDELDVDGRVETSIYTRIFCSSDFFLKVCLFFKCPPQQKRVGIIFLVPFFVVLG